jgi:hypothetical protein
MTIPYGWREVGTALVCNFSCGWFYQHNASGNWFKFEDVNRFSDGWFIGPKGGRSLRRLDEFDFTKELEEAPHVR